jgi:hypothetical protein
MVKMQGFGVSAEGVDKRYYDKSLEDGKNFGFFETIDQQIDMIVNMGEGNEDAMIMHSLEDLDNMEKDFDELLSDWKHGSTNIMDKQIKEMKNDYPALYKSLLVDRNNDWMPAIDQYLENSEVEFILVGTLHLHGSDGLLALLKDQGYTVTQVIGGEK